MTRHAIGTPEQLRDPNYMPPLYRAIPLGVQHVLAMFVSNVCLLYTSELPTTMLV